MNTLQLSMAEQQLTGFTAAMRGEDITTLAEAMGLTSEEWDEIKEEACDYMREEDIDSLNKHFA